MLQVAYNDKTRLNDDERARALNNSYLCYIFAFLVMICSGWVIVYGVESMEPEGTSRNIKIFQNILFLLGEGFFFWLASQSKKGDAFWLRALGWGLFVIQLFLMTLSNYSGGATASKIAELKTATITELRAQADSQRKTAETLRDAAVKLSKSKHGFLNGQGASAAIEAAQQTKAAGSAVEQLSKIKVTAPIVDKIGENSYMALAGAMSLAMELMVILSMHLGGKYRKDALMGTRPIEVQNFEMLQQLLGALGVVPALAIDAPVQAVDTLAAPAEASADAPTVHRKSELGRLLVKSGGINDDTPAPVIVDTPPPSSLTPQALGGGINDDTPAPVAKARKARVARDGLPMDSGTGPLDGFRYRRAVAGVQDRTIRPSLAGLYAGVGVTAAVAHRFIDAMALAGEIVPNPDGPGWIPAPAKKAKLQKNRDGLD